MTGDQVLVIVALLADMTSQVQRQSARIAELEHRLALATGGVRQDEHDVADTAQQLLDAIT